MFNFLRRSKVIRKSQDNLTEVTDTKTHWKKGQKVTVKKGVSKNYSKDRHIHTVQGFHFRYNRTDPKFLAYSQSTGF